MVQKGRDVAIDAYRIVLMWGIVLLHCAHKGIYDCRPLTMALLFCVDGFVFISGWCGIRFGWKKILRLYGISAYATVVCTAYLAIVNHLNVGECFNFSLDLWKGYWFLHAYVLLMFLAPSINAIFDFLDGKKLASVVIPLLSIPFVWSFAQDIPFVRRFVPSTSGLQAYSGFTLLGAYVVGRLLRKYESKIRFDAKIMLGAICLLSIICVLGYGRYHSPFAVLLSACWFFVFKTYLPQHEIFGRLATFITPSIFSIYLLHSHSTVGFPLLRSLENALSRVAISCGMESMEVPVVLVSSAVIVFVACLTIDMPRRVAIWTFRKIAPPRAHK